MIIKMRCTLYPDNITKIKPHILAHKLLDYSYLSLIGIDTYI